jgi:formaldehyde-activating enzyme involved in methanogenesis
VMVALVTVHPKALDRNALYKSVLQASSAAVAQAFAG